MGIIYNSNERVDENLKKFIPKEKLSKKTKRVLNQKQRKSWGNLNPVTRKPASPKVYKRKKFQQGEDYLAETFLFL
jgi:hypothetical protein